MKSGITAIILFLGMAFLALPTAARAAELIANEPATIYYTTNGEDPATTFNTDSMTTTLPESGATTASASLFDDYYTLASTGVIWDGTDADRLRLPTADYASTYGDEASVTYTLPWTFTFYGQLFNQITADTNGNIWFGSSGSAHSFNLAINGQGPVIAVWNNDLSSYLNGGVFIQHKTNPERIVVEWQTETYTEEGRRRPNNFEAVLFQTGDIRLDYNSFAPSTTHKDFGSGISRDSGSHYLSTTAAYGVSYTRASSSYYFTSANSGSTSTLSLNFSGTGSGTITSSPYGKVCTTNCYTDYPTGTSVTLHAASQYSSFTGWSGGGCSGTGDCVLPVTANTLVTANFSYDYSQQVRRDGNGVSYHPAIQTAYNTAGNGDNIKVWQADYDESVNFNQPVNVAILGGYNADYATRNGMTALNGSLVISDGTVEIDGLQLGGSTRLSTLTIAKTGAGAGSVLGTLGGINCGATCAATIQKGAFITLAAEASGNSKFMGWTGGGCSGTSNCTTSVSSDTTVTASFAPPEQLNVSLSGTGSGYVFSSPSGIYCGGWITYSYTYKCGLFSHCTGYYQVPGPCGSNYQHGAEVALYASPYAGSVFVGWSNCGGGANGNICNLTMNSNGFVTATFGIDPNY